MFGTHSFTTYSGERGIRTPGTSQYAGFQDRCIRPLCHLSMGCWNPVDVVLLHVATHSVVLLICGCKGNAFYLFHQFFSLVFCDNFNIFSIFPCFISKRSPFAVQNESFCIVKGGLTRQSPWQGLTKTPTIFDGLSFKFATFATWNIKQT